MNRAGARFARIPWSARPRRCSAAAARGFTLVELMFTIAVAAVLITIAVPSFQHVMASSRLSTTTNDMVGALRLARLAAVKRNADTQFCGSTGNGSDTLGTACGAQTAAVYILTFPANATTTAVQARAPTNLQAHQLQLKATTTVTALRFTPSGVAYEAGTTTPFTGTIADICSDALSSKNHRVIKMIGGHVVHTDTETATCP